MEYAKLKKQIQYLQNIQKVEIGLYIQGYLVSKNLFKNHSLFQIFKQMQIIDKDGHPYNNWGSENFVICPSNKKWQQFFIQKIIEVKQELKPSAVYIDEFGFGSKTSPYKHCIKQSHNHENFDLQLGQLQILQKLILNDPNLNIYIQQNPTDLMMRYCYGSFSFGAIKAATNQQLLPLLITRFIHPQFKIYELITEYTFRSIDLNCKEKQIHQSVNDIKWAIIIAFWNGNGIYLPKNLGYYQPSVLNIIRNFNRYFEIYNNYFLGLDCQPLIYLNQISKIKQILINKFTDLNGNHLFTLLNCTQETLVDSITGIQIQLSARSLGVIEKQSFTQIYP